MKKIIYIFILLGLGVTSCEDKLQLEPFDALDVSSAFRTNTDFDNAIKGVYSSLRDGNYYGGELYLLPDVLSDNLIICSEGRFSYQNYYLFNINGNIAWFGFWQAAYVTILRTNHIIENIDNLADGAFKDNIHGQALAMRAMAHFDLARIYSKAPQFAGGSDFGIPYVTTTDAGERPTRSTVGESFAAIEVDLNAALALIGDDNGTGFFNKAAVHALMSRYYLYSGNLTATITSADAAIAASVNGGVASLANFPSIWTDETEDGVIFKVINTDLDQVRVGVSYNQKSPDGIRSEYVPDFGLYNQYIVSDVRRDSYFETSDFAGSSFNHVIKYLQRPGSNQAVVDMKVLRWSEMYLNRAEAKAATDPAGALADLDMVRSQRYSTPVAGGETGAALVAAIQLERRLELAFEGHRLFDLKRQGLDISRSNSGDYSDGTGILPPASALTLPASDVKFQMPIPQEELNANPNIQPNPSNG
jgi:hypothetical protein